MRRTLPLFAVAVLLLLGDFPNAAEAADSPNIILIFADDLGYGDIGPFGAKNVRTPNLDRLAAEGRKFTSFYATPVCSMSRACLLTGCYNARVSMPGVLFPNSRIGLHADEITFAEVVKQQGYSTICIGKWHLGHCEPFLPTRQGFDSFFGIPYSNDMSIDPEHAHFANNCVFREGMNESKAREKRIPNTVPLMRNEQIVEYPADQATLTRRYTEEAVKFIEGHQAKPFFIYLPHTMVHRPLAASESFRGKSESGLLGDAIEELDWSVGQILQTLHKMQLDERTLVIFTSDNGADVGSSAPWRGKKASNFEGGVREPCIMRWPGHIPAGTECSQIAGNIDLLPTFARLVGAALPSDRTLDGRDISSLMFDTAKSPVRDTHLYFAANQELEAIRQGDWKLFVNEPGGRNNRKEATGNDRSGRTLFNLADDPGETTNVAAENPAVVDRMISEARQREADILKQRRPIGQIRDPK